MPKGLDPDCCGKGTASVEQCAGWQGPLYLAGVRDCQVEGLGNTLRSGERGDMA